MYIKDSGSVNQRECSGQRDQSISQIVDHKRMKVKIERNFLYPGLDFKKNISKKIYTENSE